jgi:L-lysine 6-transaminase
MTTAPVSSTQATAFPGPVSAAMLDEMRNYVIYDPYPFVLDLAKGKGMELETVDGQRLFDWVGYYGSRLLAHNHPDMVESEFLQRLGMVATHKVANPDFLTPECLAYYRMLHRVAPESMRNDHLEVYAVNSGAEAVENMMKYLVSRFNCKHRAAGTTPTARRFVYFDRAFHGRTVYALGVTQTMDPVATQDFHGLISGGNIKLPFPALDTDKTESENLRASQNALDMLDMVLQQMASEVVGIIVEPIQGAGGQRMALPSFFRGLSELAHKHGVALAFDEVQTGLGATGRMFAIDHFDLPYSPLAVATGKKFGAGVIYMKEPLEEVGVLDSTWGGTLADMVRVVREMEIIERDGLIEHAAQMGHEINRALRALQLRHQGIVLNVRGMGLYQGFSLDSSERKAAVVRTALREHGLLLLGAGERSIRLRPNLNVTSEDVERLIAMLDEILTAVANEPLRKEPSA